MDWHPIQGSVEILLNTSRYRNWDKLRHDGPLDAYACRLYLTLPYQETKFYILVCHGSYVNLDAVECF